MNITTQLYGRKSPYVNNARCTYCSKYIPKKHLEKNVIGRYICPDCHTPVRLIPRKKHKNKISLVIG